MTDQDQSSADHLDQLFAAPDIESLIVTPVTTPSEMIPLRELPPPVEHHPPTAVRFKDVLRKLTPVVWVTPALLVANVGVYLWMVASGVSPWLPEITDLLKWGANYAPLTWDHEPWRLLSNMFVHCGLLHLGFNMWALWSAGRILERLVGNTGFLIIYFSSGLAGSLASLWWNVDVPSVGASGAIFGLIGAFATFIWNRADSFPLRALSELRNSLVSCIGFNLLIGASIQGIDQAAHVGGLACGLICGWILSQPLDQFTTQRRLLKNLLAGGTAALTLAILVLQHPAPPPNLLQALSDYERVVNKTLTRFNAAAKEFDASPQSARHSQNMVKVIETEILPSWQELRGRLDGLKNVPASRRELLHQLRTQLIVREESWKLLVEALRHNDQLKFAEFEKKWRQAEILHGPPQSAPP